MRALTSNPVLAVRDLEGMADWFVCVLGCTRSEVEPGNWTFCTTGEVTFMLGRCPGAPLASDIGDNSYIAYLRVDDVDAFYLHARSAGADVIKAPRDEPWGMRELGLRMPEGHRFMLGQALQPS
ncbi:MAG: VOC family protein [Chloroflexi bacterium]|nr:VOC family protein [Chloroflexota bacterium]